MNRHIPVGNYSVLSRQQVTEFKTPLRARKPFLGRDTIKALRSLHRIINGANHGGKSNAPDISVFAALLMCSLE